MNRSSEKSVTTLTGEESQAPDPVQTKNPVVPITAAAPQPYTPKAEKKPLGLKENAGVLLAGAAILIALVLFAVGHVPHAGSTRRNSPLSQQQSTVQPSNSVGSGASSILPITDTAHSQTQEADRNSVAPDEIARTAKPRTQQAAATNLGSIAPFDSQAATYQPAAQPTTVEQPVEITESRNERDAMEKPSLVFVKSTQTTAASARLQDAGLIADLGISLAPGTKLRARLEAMASTAVQTPVVAVVEYNYERNGETVVPAGTKVFGKLDAADQSGYVGIRFDSMMMPDGSSFSIEAAATDLRLRPLRGKVEGRRRGRNILVRSAAGVGEVVATLAGRGSVDQPLSEADLLRERVSNNIAQASDQEVNRLAIAEHLVVSVPADTEIYVVLQKPASGMSAVRADNASSHVPNASRNEEQLRQLLQLQKELNQEAVAATAAQ